MEKILLLCCIMLLGCNEREEEGTLDFTTLQCESYLKFIDFMQEQLEMSDELFRAGNEKHMKFVKEVKDFPYKCIHLGMEGGMEGAEFSMRLLPKSLLNARF